MQPKLSLALGPLGHEFSVDASDGMGWKTEAPWVRIFAPSMSPSPREGFYVVMHFAADGSAVFITVGCGSTIWESGDLRPVSDTELLDRTSWARSITLEAFGALTPFDDQIALGAKASLPRTFEKATAFAKRLSANELSEAQFKELLVLATYRLQKIYEAQRAGRNLTGAAAIELTVEQLVAPGRARAARQGFGLTSGERRAVEIRAMRLAQEWLEVEGFAVKDVSANCAFDFEATKSGQLLKIEVKGTTNDESDAILMTHREVALHQTEKGNTGLIIVSGIRLDRTGGGVIAKAGSVEAQLGWDIDTWEAAPLAYRLTRPVD